MSGEKGATTGLTKDAGWEIGVSRTVPYPMEEVWSFLTGPAGLALWLGEVELPHAKGARYETAQGTTGEVRSFHDTGRLRLTWRPRGWVHDTTLQVTVSPGGSGGTVIRFHQEWLTGPEERARQREHWRSVMAAVVGALS